MVVEAAVTIDWRDFDAAIFDLDGVLTGWHPRCRVEIRVRCIPSKTHRT
jgi:hypothetical protein